MLLINDLTPQSWPMFANSLQSSMRQIPQNQGQRGLLRGYNKQLQIFLTRQNEIEIDKDGKGGGIVRQEGRGG